MLVKGGMLVTFRWLVTFKKAGTPGNWHDTKDPLFVFCVDKTI